MRPKKPPTFDTEVINNEGELSVGYVTIPTRRGGISIACLSALHPGARKGKGIGFRDRASLKKAIAFLVEAEGELFGDGLPQ